MLVWNGSREAARAAFDALPFMMEADKTEVFVVDPVDGAEDDGSGGAEIAAALARHGAQVSVAIRDADGDSVEDAIQDRVAATGTDLVVIGAYSHSWLHRMLYGGVTRSVLRSSTVAAFLSR